MKLLHQHKSTHSKLLLSMIARLMPVLLLLLSFSLSLASPVQAQPSIFPNPLPNGQIGTPYASNLVAAGGTPPYTWSVISGALPTGLTLNAAGGTISGTPTTAGTFSFVVRVTDSAAATGQQGFFITVAAPPLVFLTSSLPDAKESTGYTATMSIKGGIAPYTFSLVTGSLPTGLSLSATTGRISGIPAKGTAGTSSFIIGVTDSSTPPLSGQQNFSIVIEKGAFEPLVTIGSGLKAGETKVIAGNQHVATLRGGESVRLSLELGTRTTVAVDQIVNHPNKNDVRYRAEVDKMTVSETSPSIEFPYYAEYKIDFEADPSDATQISGSGWYKEDYTLRSTAPDQVTIPDKPGMQYRFSQWVLPTGETQSGRDLKLTVEAPGTCVARYDTYYQLTLVSPYGDPQETAWYKAGSQVEWKADTGEVKIPGILGVFGGKLKPVKRSDTILMDGPKTVNVEWAPDYTMPMLLIPLAVLLLVAGIYGLYRLASPRPKPAPWAPPAWAPHPMMYQQPPPPQTTVVLMGGEQQKQLPQSTKAQLMEKFGELLDKYGDEIKTTLQAGQGPALPAADTRRMEKSLPLGETMPSPAVEAEFAPTEATEGTLLCDFTSKRLLRAVAGNWKQTGTRPSAAPGEESAESNAFVVVWARDIYQEWEVFNCSLSPSHKGTHEGETQTVYTLLNTIAEEKTYQAGEEVIPPKPHYTDGMPHVDVSARQIVNPDELPD